MSLAFSSSKNSIDVHKIFKFIAAFSLSSHSNDFACDACFLFGCYLYDAFCFHDIAGLLEHILLFYINASHHVQ